MWFSFLLLGSSVVGGFGDCGNARVGVVVLLLLVICVLCLLFCVIGL